MQLRRALLLFAIVLGLAAVVASLSSPGDRRDARKSTPVAPTPRPGSAPAGPLKVRFDAGAAPAIHRVPAGQAATVVVESSLPGTIDLEGLGLTAPVAPFAPASFEVLATRPARHEVRLTAAGEERSRSVGVLVVRRTRQLR